MTTKKVPMMKKFETSTATMLASHDSTTKTVDVSVDCRPRQALKGGADSNKKRHYVESAHSFRKPRIQISDTKKSLILHIDDDVDLVDAVTSRLSAGGFRVASATDGMAGVQSAMIFPVNAVILDFDMPNGCGDTVIDLLKANEKTKDVPIIVLTAVHKKGLKRELLNKGADVFMTKPFEYAELEKAVKDLIN
jgi:CheY-like chemotaxis protein